MEPPESLHCTNRNISLLLSHFLSITQLSVVLDETHMKEVEDDVFFHSKQRDTKQGDNHQLDRADFSQEGAVCNQTAGAAEVCVDYTMKKKEHVKCTKIIKPVRLYFHFSTAQRTSQLRYRFFQWRGRGNETSPAWGEPTAGRRKRSGS